jgi:hypothetical protein
VLFKLSHDSQRTTGSKFALHFAMNYLLSYAISTPEYNVDYLNFLAEFLTRETYPCSNTETCLWTFWGSIHLFLEWTNSGLHERDPNGDGWCVMLWCAMSSILLLLESLFLNSEQSITGQHTRGSRHSNANGMNKRSATSLIYYFFNKGTQLLYILSAASTQDG